MAKSLFQSPAAEARFFARYDAVLEKWPVPYEALDIPTQFGTTRVIASGPADRPALALLHCLNGTATVWRPNVEAWSRDYRVLAIDVLGQHNRSVPILPIPDRAGLATWLREVMAGLGIKRASFAGNSFGGFLALNQAILVPEMVEKLVLISPAGCFAPLPVGRFLLDIGLPAMLGLWSAVRGRFVRMLESGIALDPDWLELITRFEGRLDYMGSPPTVFSTAELGGVAAPTLLLIAEREILYKPADVLELALSRMKGLRAEIVPNANHVAAMSNPAYVNRRVLEFLRS